MIAQWAYRLMICASAFGVCALNGSAIAQDRQGSSAAAPAIAQKSTSATACKGLGEAQCKSHGVACRWIVPKKANAKTGKVGNPYCRKVSRPAKKS